MSHIVTATRFSGPLPPPEVLEHYDRVVPGTARRLLNMAERQAVHRQALESRVIHSDILNSRIGLVFGLLIGLGGLTAATVIAILGHPAVGGLLGFSTLASMVGAFVYGSRLRHDERTPPRAGPSGPKVPGPSSRMHSGRTEPRAR